MPLNDPLDVEALRAAEADLDTLQNRPSRKPPRHRHGEAFVKRPLPWNWFRRALRLTGKAVHVALLVWKEAGCQKSRAVRFRLRRAAELGMHPDTAKRGLRALASAELVSIRHLPGRALEVTLRE